MKAHIINLEKRTDRKEQQINECLRVGFEPVIHKGIDGLLEFVKEAPNKRLRGHFGALQSHRNVLKSLKGTAPYHLIIEDDVLFIDDVLESMLSHVSSLPENWSLCYFGGHLHTMENATEEYNDLFWYARNVLGFYCYIIKDDHIDDLLETLESRLWKVDMLAIEYQHKNKNVYMTKKCHAWVRESYSDIAHAVINPDLRY